MWSDETFSERCLYVSGTFLESFIASHDFIGPLYRFGRDSRFWDRGKIFAKSPILVPQVRAFVRPNKIMWSDETFQKDA